MKLKILGFMLLVGLAVLIVRLKPHAQVSAIPVAASVAAGTMNIINTSTQPIVMTEIEIAYDGHDEKGMYCHDHYFDHSLGVGESEADVLQSTNQFSIPAATPTVLFVQFEDGTTWGTTSPRCPLSTRTDQKAMLLEFQSDFATTLKQKPANFGQLTMLAHIRGMQKQYGDAAAVSIVNSMLAMAQNREASGKFQP